jgi:tripartite-type tricarboxylate transporter receptor subunit TctC
MIEAGVPGFVVTQWHGLVVPAATPRAMVERLQNAVAHATRQPDVVQRLAADGTLAVGSTSQQFGAFMRSERDKWAKIIRQLPKSS